MLNLDISELLRIIPAVLLALTFHETAHGFIAYKLGDTTARDRGRLTVNPFKHIDWMGLICMIFLGFGWAKPVPVNPRNFKHPKRGMALVAAAGPFANLLLSVTCVFIAYVLTIYFYNQRFLLALAQFFYILATLSAGFAIFNLLPLPPLDGSRIIIMILPPKILRYVFKYEQFIHFAVIVLLVTGVLSTPLGIARDFIMNGFERFALWILL